MTEAENIYQRAHNKALAADDPIAAALADVFRSGSLSTLARFNDADELLAQAVTALEQHPPGVELLQAYVSIASGLVERGMFGDGVDRANQALDLADRLGNRPPQLMSAALSCRGRARIGSGDSGGESDLHQALELAGPTTSPRS